MMGVSGGEAAFEMDVPGDQLGVLDDLQHL